MVVVAIYVNYPYVLASDLYGREGAERRLTNVAPGIGLRDGVNVEQLEGVRQEARRGIAGAVSLATGLQPSMPGKTTLNAGIGHYKDQTALGIGVRHWLKIGDVDQGKRVMIDAGASMSEGGGEDNVYRVGVGVEF